MGSEFVAQRELHAASRDLVARGIRLVILTESGRLIDFGTEATGAEFRRVGQIEGLPSELQATSFANRKGLAYARVNREVTVTP
jgi:hypothetical protein